jgi:hypothetical protein
MVAAAAVQSVTSLPLSPAEDRRKRIRQYVTAMSIRTVCFVLAVFVPGWGHLIFGIAAMVLPYFAVVLANAGSTVDIERAQPVQPQVREITSGTP